MHFAEAVLKPAVSQSVCEKPYFPFRMWLTCFSKQGGVNLARCDSQKCWPQHPACCLWERDESVTVCVGVFLTNNQVAMETIASLNHHTLFPVDLFLVSTSGKKQHIFFSYVMFIFLSYAHIKLLTDVCLFLLWCKNILLRSLQSDLKDKI